MALRTRRESLFKFLESLSENAWQLNLEKDEIRTSATFWGALGYDLAMLPLTRQAARDLLHPLDLELAVEEVEHHLRADEPFEIEVRVRAANGEWRCVRIRGCAIHWDSQEKPCLIGGILNDITEQIVAARARSRAEDLIATLSPRERQVVSCLVAGEASKNIAHGLGISQRTVEGYRARVMEKLGVQGVGDLVQLAVAGGVTAVSSITVGQT